MKTPDLTPQEWDVVRSALVQAAALREAEEQRENGDVVRSPELKTWQRILSKWKE